MRDVETNWLQGQSIKYSESPNFKRFNTTLGRLVWAQTSFLQLPSRCVYTKFNHTYIHVYKYTILCVNEYSFIHIKYINHPLGICLKGLDPWFCCEKTFSQPTPKKQDQQLRVRYPKQIYKIMEQTPKNFQNLSKLPTFQIDLPRPIVMIWLVVLIDVWKQEMMILLLEMGALTLVSLFLYRKKTTKSGS